MDYRSYKSFVHELLVIKEAGAASAVGSLLGEGNAVGRHLLAHPHEWDLAGLGVLAAPSADILQHEARKKNPDKREMAHAGVEIGGLGVLAAPVAAEAIHASKAKALANAAARVMKKVH